MMIESMGMGAVLVWHAFAAPPRKHVPGTHYSTCLRRCAAKACHPRLEQFTLIHSHRGHRVHRESNEKQALLNNSLWSLWSLWLHGLENCSSVGRWTWMGGRRSGPLIGANQR